MDLGGGGSAAARVVPVDYARVPPELKAQVPMLRRLVELIDEGKIMGHADEIARLLPA